MVEMVIKLHLPTHAVHLDMGLCVSVMLKELSDQFSNITDHK